MPVLMPKSVYISILISLTISNVNFEFFELQCKKKFAFGVIPCAAQYRPVKILRKCYFLPVWPWEPLLLSIGCAVLTVAADA